MTLHGNHASTGTQRPARSDASHEADLATVFAALPGVTAVFAADAPHFTVLTVSDAVVAAVQRPREALIGRPAAEAFARAHPDDSAVTSVETLIASLAAAVRTRTSQRIARQRYDLQRSDGRWEERYWNAINTPVLDPEDGSVRYVLHQAEDVTGSVRAEAAARESEARYRTLFDSIDEGFCVIEVLFDAEGQPADYRFLEANPAFVEQTGLVDAVGKRMRDLVPAHEAHWFEIYGRVAQTGEPVRFEAPAQALGRWYDVYAFRIDSPEDNRVAILFTDVSSRKATEGERDLLLEALQVERARLAYVFQQAPGFLAVLRGPDYVFELVNEAYYQVVGHRPLIGKPVLDALPEVRDQGFTEILDRVVETGEPFVGREVAVRLLRTPGAPPEERFVDFIYLPLAEADGTRSGIIAHGTDVTEQVRARHEIERLLAESEQARADAETARAEAEAANRAKSQFLAVMSHELRTPLNAIGGYTELMEMGIRGPVTAQQRDDLARIRASQRHLLGLINEVLNYAKLETGAGRYDLTDVPVRDALREAEGLIAPQARAKGLKLTVTDSAPGAAMRADAEKLRQILVNLLSNAVKFTEPGGRIVVAGAVEGEEIRFTVSDTGIGIPAHHLATIFEPFVQVRADLTRTTEGTGLGLAISRDLARGMGGELTATSTAGEGSTFTLTLPRA
jgi:PAS domain S-box-containing protein